MHESNDPADEERRNAARAEAERARSILAADRIGAMVGIITVDGTVMPRVTPHDGSQTHRAALLLAAEDVIPVKIEDPRDITHR